MYYFVTIAYEGEQLDRNGNPKLSKLKYLIEAESAEEATILASKFRSGDMRSSETISVSKSNIEYVIDKRSEPTYYKS
jgi:hypothetical protein